MKKSQLPGAVLALQEAGILVSRKCVFHPVISHLHFILALYYGEPLMFWCRLVLLAFDYNLSRGCCATLQ